MGVNLKFSHLLLIFYLTVLNFANAEQLLFSRKDLGEKMQFNYRWLDNKHAEQSMSFALNKTDLFTHFRQFKNYKREFSDAYIHKALKKQLQKQPLPEVQIEFSQKNGHLSVNIRGKNQAKVNHAYQTIAKLEQQYLDQYLAQNNYHRFTTHNGINAIKPDHVAIAAQSVADLKILKAIILEKVSVQNIRKVTNYVLGFVQNIPYSTLESRATSSGAGFSPPLNLIYQNQGDCDSKVTLTATILRALMPRINMIIIYIDQHALLGINIQPQSDEISIVEQGITYVLAEPTGPALYSLGQVAPFSKNSVLGGLYSAEQFK